MFNFCLYRNIQSKKLLVVYMNIIETQFKKILSTINAIPNFYAENKRLESTRVNVPSLFTGDNQPHHHIQEATRTLEEQKLQPGNSIRYMTFQAEFGDLPVRSVNEEWICGVGEVSGCSLDNEKYCCKGIKNLYG